jgi:hypothetical protein
MFHDHHALEADPAHQCVRMSSWRRYERKDIESLGMAEEKVVRCHKSSTGRRGGKV